MTEKFPVLRKLQELSYSFYFRQTTNFYVLQKRKSLNG